MCRSERCFSEEMALTIRLTYKEGRDGRHLDPIYSTMVAGFVKIAGGGELRITDVIICNVVRDNVTSESGTARLLSGMRTICQKAFGDLAQLRYDKSSTQLLMGAARRVQPIEPRYVHPVYFGGVTGVWMAIIDKLESVAALPNTSSRKARAWRDVAIFLNRLDSISRSDCECKWSLLDGRSFRCYNGRTGERILDGDIVEQLSMVIETDGFTQRNYLNPKDPRRKGKWSDTVEVAPLRPALLVDEKVPWRSTATRVGYTCSTRVLRGYYFILRSMKLLDVLPEMKVWTSCHQKTVGGKLLPLASASIAAIVKKTAADGGLRVGTSDNLQAADLRRPEGQDVLAGHFLRGHMGSVAYTLATQCGAGWDPLAGIDRARHTLQVFLNSYSRGVAPELITAFRGHPDAQRLRMEEAARL
jgi:hypothetical protein